MQFAQSLYLLVQSPRKFLQENLNSHSGILSFSIFLLFLEASAQYIAFFKIGFFPNIGLAGFLFSFGLYNLFVVLLIFWESIIISAFLKEVKRNSFSTKKVISMLATSYFPFLTLPALSILNYFLSGIFLFGIILVLFWILFWKLRIFRDYKEYFILSPRLIIFMPYLLTMFTGMLFFILIFYLIASFFVSLFSSFSF